MCKYDKYLYNTYNVPQKDSYRLFLLKKSEISEFVYLTQGFMDTRKTYIHAQERRDWNFQLNCEM